MTIQSPTPQNSEIQADIVLPFTAINLSLLPIVGGKAANLGEMIHAGLPVPPGFCVTTTAYAQVAEGSKIDAILTELSMTDSSDAAQLSKLASTVRAAIMAAPMPTSIEEAITEAYRTLGEGEFVPVAVRSSATAEDLPYASFAGQQDTYLNIIGEEALIDAVRRCWASLWTDRAVSYRASLGLDQHRVQLAVVVQRMVAAEVAGVLFTANPVTGKRREAVIDANPGLGEAVVSGVTNPDHFEVNTATGEIVERRLSDKRIVIRGTADGGTVKTESGASLGEACLSDAQIGELAQLGAQVEAHYGMPQDIEWAIDATGKLWLTQSRPITTLYPLPANAPDNDDELRVYWSLNVFQGVFQPLTPMGIAVLRLIGSTAASLFDLAPHDPLNGPSILVDPGSRLFADVTAALRTKIGRTFLIKATGFAEARSSVLLQQLTADSRLSLKPTPRWRVIHAFGSLSAKTRAPLIITQAAFKPRAAVERMQRTRARLEALRVTSPENNAANPADRLKALEQLMSDWVEPLFRTFPPILASGIGSWGLASRLLKGIAAPDELQILPPILQQGLADFLHHYGHRGVAEIDVGLPRWREDPTHILGVLANYLQLNDPALAPDAQFRRGAQEAEAMVADLIQRATRKSRLRGMLVGFFLKRARAMVGLREMPKFCLILIVAYMREVLQSVGKEIAEAGCLGSDEDIFFLTLQEAHAAQAGEDMRDIVRERRMAYEYELQRRHVPRVLLSDGTEPSPAVTDGAESQGMLRGTPASPGSITGPARVILDPTGAHLEPGEILVAPSTDPGWTPLFLTAGGLVMEMGGSISHGAVVAREYGIPAVVGVTRATERIITGQQITVDGSHGIVTLEK